MSEIVFECRKCGTCCRNLCEEINGVKKGLLLTRKETKLFPSEMISPQIALGGKKPRRIIAYQLSVDTCPHLDERNECRIYEKRPLMCKAFPYESGTVSIKCSVFSHIKEGEPCTFIISSIELMASERINRYIENRYRRYFKKGFKKWSFDLATKKWKPES